ncbi:hypothetical protein uan_078 [Pseudomonas phage UAntarctica]|nr:hypothetical protein uan_078 [Pseudomonas phage UAntarctica]
MQSGEIMKDEKDLVSDKKLAEDLLERLKMVRGLLRDCASAGATLCLTGSYGKPIAISSELLQLVATLHANAELKFLREHGVNVQGPLDMPGFTYSGEGQGRAATVVVSPTAAAVLAEGLGLIKAEFGTWALKSNGELHIGVAQRKSQENHTCSLLELGRAGFGVGVAEAQPFAVIDGVTYLNQEDLNKAWVSAAKVPTEGEQLARLKSETLALSTRVSSLEGNLSQLGSQTIFSAAALEVERWNPASTLATVESPLMLKIPAGTELLDDNREPVDSVKHDQVMNGMRTAYITNKDGEMEYRLSDNSLVIGKFEWTHA